MPDSLLMLAATSLSLATGVGRLAALSGSLVPTQGQALAFAQLVLMFAVISCGGWAWETLYCSLVERHLVRRGVLYGPSCPIYGTGAVVVWLALGSLSDPMAVFLLGAALATAVEYATGAVLERRFHRTWWDYSMFRLNYKGRVCALASATFGGFSLLVVFLIGPSLLGGLASLPAPAQLTAAALVALAYAADALASFAHLSGHDLTDVRERLLAGR